MKRVAILGSTGSIGQNALRVIENLGSDFSVFALSCHHDAELLAEQALRFTPKIVNIADAAHLPLLQKKLSYQKTIITTGEDELCSITERDEVDLILNGIMGSAGFRPTLSGVQKGKRIALANKETLVSFGPIIIQQAKTHGAEIIPVDSEHSAIFQCIQGNPNQKIKRIFLTTSGGPFRDRENLHGVTIEETLNHPVWSMGKRITVNSATMMNKALEIIEAHFLFGIPSKDIVVIIHPECIIHSAVEFEDNSIIAQLSHPDMTLPIQYALTFPERKQSITEPLEMEKIAKLTFAPVSTERFPALSLAYRCLEKGGTTTSVLNASNEIFVDAFLEGKMPLDAITDSIEAIVEKHTPIANPSILEVYQAENWARGKAKNLLP